MGGGDLNMKKHFHPLTIENLERVWKAEERVRKEREKMEELQKELHEERQREALQRQAIESGIKRKKSEKLDWMYSSQHQKADTSEYLLGKRIDKNVEVMKEDEKQTLAQGVVSAPTRNLPKAGDILAKVKEDPLFLIKKREEDNRKTLADNPLRMRKMKELLKQKMATEKHSKNKKEKKKRDESPGDQKKYRNGSRHVERHSEHRQTSRERHSHISDSEKDTKKHYHSSSKRNKEKTLSDASEGEEEKDKKERDSRLRKESKNSSSALRHDQERKRMEVKTERDRRIEFQNDHSDKYSHRNPTRSPDRGRRASNREKRESPGNYKSNEHYANRSDERKSDKKRYRNKAASSDDDDAEIEAKRRAMVENAKQKDITEGNNHTVKEDEELWRQTQRSENIKRYKAKDKQEEKMLKDAHKKVNVVEEKAKFIRKIETASYIENDISVEDRIRRTIHSKQRTNADLSKKFTSR